MAVEDQNAGTLFIEDLAPGMDSPQEDETPVQVPEIAPVDQQMAEVAPEELPPATPAVQTPSGPVPAAEPPAGPMDTDLQPITAGISGDVSQVGMETFAAPPRQPSPLLTQYRTVKKLLSGSELDKTIEDIGYNYINGIIRTTGDQARDDARVDFLQRATSFGVAELNEKGEVIRDANDQPIISQTFPLEAELEGDRAIELFESLDNPSGVYVLYDEQGNKGVLDLDEQIKSLTRDSGQMAGTAPFIRIENLEEGGLGFYNEILQNAGVSDPYRRLYYLRQQAMAGPFGGIEGTRVGAAVTDYLPAMANFGIMAVDWGIDLTLAAPAYITELTQAAVSLGTYGGDVPFYRRAQESRDFVRDTLSFGFEMPYIDLAVDRYAEQFNVPIEEAEAVFGYTPDIASAFKRFAVETLIPGGTVVTGSRLLAGRTAQNFIDFAKERHKDLFPEGYNPTFSELSEKLVEKGLTLRGAMDDYVILKGGGERFRKRVERALDIDTQYRSFRPGGERMNFFASTITSMEKQYKEVSKQLDEAYKDGKPGDFLKRLQDRRMFLARDIQKLKHEYILPEDLRSYLKDEAIATTASAIAYSTIYNISEGNEGFSGIASFVSVLTSLNPRARQAVNSSIEDLNYAFQRGRYKAGIGAEPPSVEAVRLRRRVETMPEDIRDKAFAHFMELDAARAELSQFKYPDNYYDPELRGKPIISADALDQGFYRMSGLISLRGLRTQEMGDNLNIVKDAGGFSEKLARLEAQLEQENLLAEQMSDIIQSLKYYQSREGFDPNSAAGRLTKTLTDFYDGTIKELEADESLLKELLQQRDFTVNGIFAGQIDADTIDDFASGRRSLYQAVQVDLERFKKYNLNKDLSLEEQAKAIDDYLAGVDEKILQATKNYERIRGQKNYALANSAFLNYVLSAETSAYNKTSRRFDKLRDDFPDARIDMTDVFDDMVDGVIVPDDVVLNGLSTRISGEGSVESRRIAGLELDNRTDNGIMRLFNRSASEAVERIKEYNPQAAQMVEELLESQELTNANGVTQFLAVRAFFEKNGLNDVYDLRIGLDPAEFMHVVSALGSRAEGVSGKTKAIPLAQLRENILNGSDGRTFERNFHAPITDRETIPNWLPRYAEAREAYKTDYIDPFRNMNNVISRTIRNPEAKTDVDIDSFNKFLVDVGFGRESPLLLAEIETKLMATLRATNGGKLDVTKGRGKMLRQAFTRIMAEQILKTTVGGRLMGEIMTEAARAGAAVEIIPSKAAEVQKFMQDFKEGRIKTESGLNLANFYMMKDDNGVPLIDQDQLDHMMSVDFLATLDPMGRSALNKIENNVQKDSARLLKEMADIKTEVGQEMAARRRLAKGFENTQGFLGAAIFQEVQKQEGTNRIRIMRDDFIKSQEGVVPAEQAGKAFDQVVQQSVIEHIFSTVTEVGNDRMTTSFDAYGNKTTRVRKTQVLDAQKLGQLLGFRGDNAEMSQAQAAITEILGEEVVEHMRTVYKTLYDYSGPESKRPFRVTGISMPMSAESALSRVTSYFRGVISMRWLVSEAAIRKARESNYELTKIMLFDPKVGREVLDMLASENFTPERFVQVEKVLLTEIAKNDAIAKFAWEDLQSEEEEGQESDTSVQLQQILQGATDAAGLIFNP